jgi:predicted Rossmann-fold nucleotide-binding protein
MSTLSWVPLKVISGGQTGVDRAGLDAAVRVRIPTGGFTPKGRKAEDGKVPEKYNLIELHSHSYEIRTERNVLESDGTLILAKGELTGGTLLTENYAKKHHKPFFILELNNPDIDAVRMWGISNKIETVNVAGPRESQFPEGIYANALKILNVLFLKGS